MFSPLDDVDVEAVVEEQEPNVLNSAIRWAAVTSLIAGLAPRQRAVLEMRWIDGVSTAETASALGCAEGTVKATLHTARQALRDALHRLEQVD